MLQEKTHSCPLHPSGQDGVVALQGGGTNESALPPPAFSTMVMLSGGSDTGWDAVL